MLSLHWNFFKTKKALREGVNKKPVGDMSANRGGGVNPLSVTNYFVLFLKIKRCRMFWNGKIYILKKNFGKCIHLAWLRHKDLGQQLWLVFFWPVDSVICSYSSFSETFSKIFRSWLFTGIRGNSSFHIIIQTIISKICLILLEKKRN